jgi:hypothetical protein
MSKVCQTLSNCYPFYGQNEKIGGERALALANTHTPLEDNKSSKNSGEDSSCQPLSTPVEVNVGRSLSALVDVNVERSPRHIMSVSSS